VLHSGGFLASLANIKLGLKGLLGTNALAYLAHSKVKKKLFCIIGHDVNVTGHFPFSLTAR